MTKLELTDVEIESFKAWQQHRERFEVLLRAKAFDVRPGVVSFSINKDGVITRIFAQEVEMYRRKSEKKSYPL